jgi:hypothetical protein
MDLETNLKEKRKEKKEREKVYLCSPVAWRPASHRPALPSLFCLGRAEPSVVFLALLSGPRGPAQEPQRPCAPPSLVMLTVGARCQSCLLPLIVAEPETDVASNQINRESRDFLTEHGILGL